LVGYKDRRRRRWSIGVLGKIARHWLFQPLAIARPESLAAAKPATLASFCFLGLFIAFAIRISKGALGRAPIGVAAGTLSFASF
jgi:hypothetical protein